MIGRLIGALVGRKAKEQIADTVLDKVNLPDPIEGAIKAAVTGNPADLMGFLDDKSKPKRKVTKK